MSWAKTRLIVLCVVCHGATAFADAGAPTSFGPWDAGDQRAVTRQGETGAARHAHPMLGDAAHVPASGPPLLPPRRDEDVPELALVAPNRIGPGLSANPLYLAALFYRHFLTKVDGPRCQHLPTCSQFASQAVARHGGLGILMGLERLIQDDFSSAVRRLPEVQVGEHMRFFDPVDNYVFWATSNATDKAAQTKEVPLELPTVERSPRTPQAAPPAGLPSAATPSPFVLTTTSAP